MDEKKFLTYEEIMALFAESAKMMVEHDKKMAKLWEEHDKKMAKLREEHDKKMAKLREQHDKKMADHDEKMKQSHEECDKRIAQHDKEMAELREQHKEIAELQKKTDEQMKKTDEKLDRLAKNVGGINDNIGFHAEQYFQNVFDKKLSFGDQKYDYMRPNLKYGRKGVSAEFDIVLVNGESVAVIETKSRIHPKFIEELATEKVSQFRRYYPEYKNYKLYLGAAGFSFDGSVIEEAKKYGIGVIRQVGEALEINDSDLKIY